MTANATHPGRITIPGTDVGVKGTLVAEPQTVNELLTLSDRLALGPVKVDTDPTGVLESPGLVVPIVSGVLWLLRFEPHRHDVPPFTLGVYNLNTSGVDLKDLVVTDPLAVDATLITDLQGLVDDAEAAAAAAVAVGTTNDTIVAGLVGSASATRTAMDGRYSPTTHRITSYGAVGDGSTNDAAALNAAGAAAASSGMPVVLPYTTNGYAFSTATNLVSGVTYILDGNVKVKRTGTTSANLWNAAATTGVTIRGGTFDGNGLVTGNTVAPGVRTTITDATFIDSGQQQQACYPLGTSLSATTSDVFVARCRFVNMRNNIHIAGNASRWTVKDCDISGYGAGGIAIDGDATHSSSDIILEGNRLHDHNSTVFAVSQKQLTGTTAILTTAAHTYTTGDVVYVDVGDANYDGNHLLTATTGTTVTWAKTATASGPTASTGYVSVGNRQPISVQGDTSDNAMHKRIRISGNQVLGNYSNHQSTTLAGTADQISVHHTESFEVSDNVCEGSGDVGITISLRCHSGVIANNTVRGAGNIGIAVGAATAVYLRDLTITGNNVMNSGQNGTTGWGGSGINIRTLTGGLVEGNYCGDDQVTPTQQYGISVGDTTGTSDQVHFGLNHGRRNVLGKRLTLAGNTNLTFTDNPLTVVKTADTIYNNTTTLANDPHLVVPLEANAVYEIDGVVGFNTNGVTTTGAPGVKLGWAALAGASFFWTGDSGGSNSTGAATTVSNSNRSFLTFAATLAAGGVTGATNARVILKGRFTVGTVAGNLQLQGSQNTADATNSTTTVTGSWLKATRIS